MFNTCHIARYTNLLMNFTKQSIRHSSTKSTSSNLAVLILGNSNIGNYIAEKSIKEGHKVLVTTRSPVKKKTQHPIKYIHTPPAAQKTSNFWQHLAEEHLDRDKKILVVNTIGGSVAAPGQTMDDLNVHIPSAAVEGIVKGIEKKLERDYSIVHLSTSAAENLKAPYGETKRKGEKALMNIPNNRLTIFRMSYVAEAYFKDKVKQTYKDQHRLSAEEFALLPFTPLIGDPWDYKRVIIQPVAMDDIATATYNTFNLPKGQRIIDAVGHEEMTQEQFFKFYTDLLGKKFRPLHIPIGVGEIMAKHHPFGHCTPYAVEFCSEDRGGKDAKEFEKLVGKPLKTLSDVYQTQSEREFELVLPRPPILSFTNVVLRNLWRNPTTITETLRAMYMFGNSLILNSEKPLLHISSDTKPLASYRVISMSEDDFNKNSLKNRLSKPD